MGSVKTILQTKAFRGMVGRRTLNSYTVFPIDYYNLLELAKLFDEKSKSFITRELTLIALVTKSSGKDCLLSCL